MKATGTGATQRERTWKRTGALWGAAVLVVTAGWGCAETTPPPENPDPPPISDGEDPGGEEGVAPASSPKVQEGIDAIQAGDFQAAKAALEEAHAANPGDAQAAFYLGVALEGLGDAETAQAKYEAALAADPKLTEASVNLSGLLLDVRQDPAGAQKVAEDALANAPKHPALLTNRGLALFDQGKPAEAAKAFAAALESAPDDAGLRLVYVTALARAGDAETAKAELRKVTVGDVETAGKVANLFGQLEAFEDCVKTFDKAVGMEKAPLLFVKRALCKKELGDAAGEKADYEAALKLDPEFAPAHYYLGRHLCSAGKKKEGKAALDKAAKQGKDQGVAKAAQKALAKCK